MTKKVKPFSLCIIIALIGLLLGATLNLASSQSTGTQVSGIIDSNTSWTKAGSPYNLAGNLLLNYGVTLTVESGVTVNLNDYYIMINGTLQAIGSIIEPINFNEGEIIFTQNSTNWNEDTSDGCIIQNCILTTSITAENSPKVCNNTCNNAVSIQTTSGTSLVTGNVLKGGLMVVGNGLVNNNTITGQGMDVYGSNLTISNNIIIDCSTGIVVRTSHYIASWHWTKFTTVIENNLIMNNADGINLDAWAMFYSCSPHIINNTITNNTVGLSVSYLFGTSNPILLFNNIYGNHDYNIRNSIPDNDINATYNWWGTTNTTIIDQLIYDYYDDFSLGKVTYTPALSESNSEAPPILIPETATCLVTALFLALISTVMVTLKRKRTITFS